MDNFKDLQDTWKNQDAPELPGSEIIKKNIMKLKNDLGRKYLFAILSLSATAVVMLLLLFFIDFEYVTSQLALILLTVTLAIAISKLIKLRKNIFKADKLQHSSKDYLAHLKKFKAEQLALQQRGMDWYFTLMTAFMYLYFWGIYKTSTMVGISAYILTTLWILFVWFYMRPRQAAKYNQRINNLIAEVEGLENQLK